MGENEMAAINLHQDKCLQLELMEDTDSRKLWISKEPMLDSDWPVWFILKLEYMEEYLSDREIAEFGGKYCVSVEAVAPEALSGEQLKRVQESMDFYDIVDEEVLSIMIADYGCKATLFSKAGNNMKLLLREARKELIAIRTLFGFYMDRPQNMIGNTGWDFIKGEIGYKK